MPNSNPTRYELANPHRDGSPRHGLFSGTSRFPGRPDGLSHLWSDNSQFGRTRREFYAQRKGEDNDMLNSNTCLSWQLARLRHTYGTTLGSLFHRQRKTREK